MLDSLLFSFTSLSFLTNIYLLFIVLNVLLNKITDGFLMRGYLNSGAVSKVIFHDYGLVQVSHRPDIVLRLYK